MKDKLDYVAYCSRFSDKHLDGAIAKIEDGIKELELKNPKMPKKANILNYGLRGTRYFIEFPITGKDVDALAIISAA